MGVAQEEAVVAAAMVVVQVGDMVETLAADVIKSF